MPRAASPTLAARFMISLINRRRFRFGARQAALALEQRL